MYLAHRKLSNGYNPLFAKHPATDPLIECTCYIWERDCIFSHYHDKKKTTRTSIFAFPSPTTFNSKLFPRIHPIFAFPNPTISNSKLFPRIHLTCQQNANLRLHSLNFSKKRKKEEQKNVFVSDLRSVERWDGDTWRTCLPDKICPIQADRRFSQRASITCTPNSSTCW